MNEKQTPKIIIEDDFEKSEDFKSFAEIKQAPQKKKSSASTKTLVIIMSAAVILAAVLAVLLFLPKDSGEIDEIQAASVVSKLDADNVWQAQINTDENGKIENNGGGALLSFVPSDIKTIRLENEKGSFTVVSYTPKTKTKETDPETGEQKEQTDTTQYTVKGYEDFELQSGEPDQIASVCSSLAFSSVSCEDASDRLADFGLENPRGTVNVTYSDNTKAVIKVGANAPQNLGTYIMFGSSNAVFLCDTESAKYLLCTITDLISLSITDSISDTPEENLKSVALGGKNFESALVFKPNDSAEIDCDYVITSPSEKFADNTEASNITGAIRGLYASEVWAVNPSKNQLKKFGLSSPYAQIKAVYDDTVVSLAASEPDADGNCLIMNKGGKIVYKIAAANIAWVNSNPEKLVSDYVMNVDLSALKGLKVNSFKFDINTKTINTADDEGEVTTSSETIAKFGGKTLDEGNFETFFSNISLLTKREKTAAYPSGKADLSITFSYSSGRADDTAAFYKSGANKHIVTLNGEVQGTVSSSYVDKLKTQAKAVSKDDAVKSFW